MIFHSVYVVDDRLLGSLLDIPPYALYHVLKIVFYSAYHGHTQSLIDISPYKWYQSVDGKDYQPSSTHVASLPDTFRGKFRGEEAGKLYANEVAKTVTDQNGIGVMMTCN